MIYDVFYDVCDVFYDVYDVFYDACDIINDVFLGNHIINIL